MTYFDASYIVRCYLNEPGGEQVRAVAASRHPIASCEIVRLEFQNAVRRNLQENKVSPSQAEALLQRFESDCSEGVWHLLPLNAALVESTAAQLSAIGAVAAVGAVDALHLTCARLHGCDEFFTHDRQQFTAAGAFGLTARDVLPQTRPDRPQLSLVIPCYNEEGNLRELIKAIRAAVDPLKISYEVVITDDCSKDNSWAILKELAASDTRIRVQRFKFNCGESAASWAGMKNSRGRYIFTLDADLQNDPKDLPKFLEALKNFDCVCGTRVKVRGEGDHIIRVISSRTANWVRNKLSGEQISDAGCTYRAFKRECIENLKFFKGMHRFLPTLFKIEGHTVTEIEVSNNPRFAGQSNYGVWNRLFASFYDLLAVRWMKKRMFKFIVDERIN